MPSSSERADFPDEIEVGRIVRPHGVRGDVMVLVESDVEGRFARGARFRAQPPAGLTAAIPATLTVETARPHKGGLAVHFVGVDDRDRAEALRGVTLMVPREAVPPAPENTWYFWELVGCRVVDAEAGEIGTVADVIEDGGGFLLDVVSGDRHLPVPFVEAICRQVDIAAGRIDVDLPPGLLEACASRS